MTGIRPGLMRRLARTVDGEVLSDRFNRGRYATDASFYQVMPLGVVVPRTMGGALEALALARDEGVSVLPRGGGTSQCGQTVNDALVLDTSKHLTKVLDLDIANRRCTVQPGIVLDDLNRLLKPHGLWFPVDVSTASRATIGGMAGNNSCGGRSLRYGTMRDNVEAIDAVLADGTAMHFAPVRRDTVHINSLEPGRDLIRDLLALGEREAPEIAERFPKVQRRVGGYNLDALVPNGPTNNPTHVLVGSEGTLAFTTAVTLKLSPLIRNRVLGVCHFASFRQAMEAPQNLVGLGPIAIELIDRTMLDLGRRIALYRPTIEKFVHGDPDALLVVEFAEEDQAENMRRLGLLSERMGDLGYIGPGSPPGGVIQVNDPALATEIAEFRAGGLNVMMSMREAGKPISFVEDCAVPLDRLADYTDQLTRIFTRHGTRGTWYAHASVGCLHVRPVLNLKLDKDAKTMRAIAEEAFALVRSYKGSHSGEHGDGLVRSEFHEAMFGPRIVRAFEAVKDRFDPTGLFNPNRIVRPPRMDDRRLFRYGPDYRVSEAKSALDWSDWPGGFQGAAEMCNNNGACRKREPGVMCPSYRVTRDERDVTRGRANTLRLALSGQLGPDALASDEMAETLKLCVSCKACRHECPTGVDMARMKIEVQAAQVAARGLALKDRLVAWLPHYAGYASRVPWIFNARDRIPGLAALSERLTGFSARRPLPRWRRDAFRDPQGAVGNGDAGDVVLLADTFNRWFEPENLHAALTTLSAGGWRVHVVRPVDGSKRPLCCGRTFLAAGLVEEARREARRMLEALEPHHGRPVIGLEPSCLLTLRDEFPSLLRGPETEALAERAFLFEEFLAREPAAKGIPFGSLPNRALLHGHCHQKAFGAMGATEAALRLVPDLSVETIASSCCGMAGAFGYSAETYDTSIAMAELSLLPAVRRADPEAIIVADGTSCRHQIVDGTGRKALHVARVLEMALRGVPQGGPTRI